MKGLKMKKIKTFKDLAMEVCRRERKKKQVNIAQVSEILGVLSDLVVSTGEPCYCGDTGKLDSYVGGVGLLLAKNGERRLKRKSK